MASTTYTAALQNLYVAYFNRPADTAGLAYWSDIVAKANGNTAAVSASFAASKEYKDEYGSLTSTQVITKIYNNLFGHAPDAAGRAYWVDKLDNKVFTIDQIVAEVAGGALSSDKTAITNKVAAATAFTDALTTEAQQKAYTGDDANAAAKAFIAGITTDATLTSALVPANLAASVAAVVKAGTPFTLAGGLTDLDAAKAAVETFLKGLDVDGDGVVDSTVTGYTSAAEAAAVAQAKLDAESDVAGLVPDYATSSTAVKAALLVDQQNKLDKAVADAQTAYNTSAKAADAAAGLTTAIATAKAADAAVTAAQKAEVKTKAAQDAAIASYNTLNSNAGKVVASDGTVAGVIKLDTKGNLVVDSSSITEANNPGVTALLAAVKAEVAAGKIVVSASDSASIAHLDVNIRDSAGGAEVTALADLGAAFDPARKPAKPAAPTAAEVQVEIATLKGLLAAAAPADQAAAQTKLTDFLAAVSDFNAGNVNPLAADVALKQTALDNATEAVSDLAKAVIALNEVSTTAGTLDNLNAAVKAANDAFASHDFKAPVELTAVFAAATAGSDIYLASTNNTTIANFGLQGDDVLYIGKGYTWNKGALSTGDNAVLEVFLTQSGANTIVQLETKAFGSNSTAEAEIQITLTGVNASDLTIKDGIISFA